MITEAEEQTLISELRSIADRLLKLSEEFDEPYVGQKVYVRTPKIRFSDQFLGNIAKIELRLRQQRYKYLDGDIIGEPCWDMLLDLYVAFVENTEISVTSACTAACVPPTTALRYLEILTERGLVARYRDERDARRVFVNLTDLSLNQIRSILQEYAVNWSAKPFQQREIKSIFKFDD